MPSPSWPVHSGMVGERNDMVVGQQSPVLNRLPGACSRGYLIGDSTILAAIISLAMPCYVQVIYNSPRTPQAAILVGFVADRMHAYLRAPFCNVVDQVSTGRDTVRRAMHVHSYTSSDLFTI